MWEGGGSEARGVKGAGQGVLRGKGMCFVEWELGKEWGCFQC